MEIAHEAVTEGFCRIALSGRMDVAGNDSIALKFTALTATQRQRVVVDLRAVIFLGSIGIRSLIANARALQQRGGRMVFLVGDNAVVSRTLEVTGIDVLVPMFTDAAEADRAALA